MATATREKLFYSIPELMERWGVSRATIYALINRGDLTRTHIGTCVRFSSDEVRRFEEASKELTP